MDPIVPIASERPGGMVAAHDNEVISPGSARTATGAPSDLPARVARATTVGESDRVAEQSAGAGTDRTDAELISAMVESLEALDLLYERYKTIAYSIAYRVTNDAALAEDVVQDAFLCAWRNAERYIAGRGSVKTWLLAIVHHCAIDAVRRRKPTTDLPAVELVPPPQLRVPDVWAEVSAELDADDVRRALATLSEVQREALELAHFGGLTQQEVADRMNTPLGTVKSRMHLGLMAMHRVLTSGHAARAGSGRKAGWASAR
ncbi:hypothetical protein BH20CHL7_BH20CHL7_05070 [soil metagenome]